MDDIVHCLNGITVNKNDIDLVEIISVLDRNKHWSTYVYLYGKDWMQYDDEKIYNYINIFYSLDPSKEYIQKQNKIESVAESFRDYAVVSVININVDDGKIKLDNIDDNITISIKDICKSLLYLKNNNDKYSLDMSITDSVKSLAYLDIICILYKRSILHSLLSKDEMEQFISSINGVYEYEENYSLDALISFSNKLTN